MAALRATVETLADEPPREVDGMAVAGVTDYRRGASARPPWLGAQALVELDLGDTGRILVRPSGTEPKLKIYVDLTKPCGEDVDTQHLELSRRASSLGDSLAASLGV